MLDRGSEDILKSEDILACLHLAVSHQFKVNPHMQLIIKQQQQQKKILFKKTNNHKWLILK